MTVHRILPALLALAALLGLPASAAATGFVNPLPIPDVLTGADIEIPIQEAQVQILPGATTTMWTYGGTFPGPTIRRTAGEQTKVTFVNELPAGAGALTVHRHGGHSASAHDGQPHGNLGDGPLIGTGQSRTYTYDLMEDGAPERGAFEWYHDHRLDLTGRNVWNGLAGMFIVDDPAEAELDLPAGDYDVPLMLLDRSFGVTNQLEYPLPVPFPTTEDRFFTGTGPPPDDSLLGNHLLVNGAVQPYFGVEPRRYRLRLLNASNGRVLGLSFEDDAGISQPVEQIATESGLLPAPATRSSIELGPAERAEVVIDFADFAGETVVLDTSMGEAIEFRVDGTRVVDDSAPVPDALRPVPEFGDPVRSRSFDLGLAEDPAQNRKTWTINNRTFDPARTDAEPKIGTTETWSFTGGQRTHTVHVHGVDFRIVSRSSKAVPLWESGLKETFLVAPKETVVIELRFTDHLGEFVFHCHMVEHEDNGMMGRALVSETGDTPPDDDDPEDPVVTPVPTVSASPTPEPSVTPAPAPAAADLALRWLKPPSALKPRTRAALRLQIVNRGEQASATQRLRLALPKGWTGTGLSRSVAPVGAGASQIVAFKVKVPGRLPKRASLVARLADHRAALGYRRRGGKLRLASRASAASLLCRLRP